MKHYNADTKKFIKNVVSLTVSALLLAAATFAWFASEHEATVGKVTATMNTSIQFDYMHLASTGNSYLDGSASGLTVRDRSVTPATNQTAQAFVTGVADGSWTGSSGTAWNLSSMYPGEFGAYKISYTSDGNSTRKLIFDTVTCADANAKASICVFAMWQSTAPGEGATPTVGGSTTTTLNSLMTNPPQDGKINVLTGITATSGYKIDIFLVVGMPATDFAGVHNALRQTGATVTINKIDAVAASGS